jgi:beta-lactamase class A
MRRHVLLIWLFAAVTVICVAGCATASAAGSAPATGNARPRPETATAKPSASSADARPENASAKPLSGSDTQAVAKQPAAQQGLGDAVGSLISGDDGHAAVAVDDLTTGETASDNGGDDDFVTASIVKVDILATLLYQSQQSGQPLTDDEQELATTMIENSDNDAASDLYDAEGGASAIDDANKFFSLTGTVVGTDGYWGLTTTTADDQVRLLRQVFTTSSALSSSSRAYLQGLMSQVEPDQQWGVTAAAGDGTEFWVKNGWLPNPDLWEINSIGQVTHDGQHLLVAVLSEDNDTESGGISLVENIAQQAADALSAVG